MSLTPGARLGQYEILARIGSGGMGEVYRARDARLNRDVAIKVLPSAFASDPDRLGRFEREAQILASLNHPNIAHVYGVHEDPPALVMEFVDGQSLDRLIPSGGLALDQALKFTIQMSDALAAAHAAGIVHRDFKPANVVITGAGVAKVLDFGLAKAGEAPLATGATATSLNPSPRTEAGVVMGTFCYMSPEQAAGRPVDARSDIFAFGSVLFEMLTGQTTAVIAGAARTAAGRFFVTHQTPRSSIASLRVAGPRPLADRPEVLTRTAAVDQWPSLSSNGSTLAFLSSRAGDNAIWVRDLASGRETSVPMSGARRSVVLSADGRSVAYVRSNDLEIAETRGGTPRKVCSNCAASVSSWTSDGRWMLVNIGPPQSPVIQVAAIDVRTGKVSPILDKDRTWFGRASPDGRWLSFIDFSAEGKATVVIAPFTPGSVSAESTWIRVTEGQSVDEESAWSADGRTLYFVSPRDGFRCIYAAGFDPSAKRVTATTAVLHLHDSRRRILPTDINPSRIDVAAGRLVFPVEEIEANIWSLTPSRRIP